MSTVLWSNLLRMALLVQLMCHFPNSYPCKPIHVAASLIHLFRQHTKLVEASVELGHAFNSDPYRGNNTGILLLR